MMNKEIEFEKIYNLYFKKVYSYFSICFNNDKSDDLSQQVFLNIWRQMNKYNFQPPDNWKAFIFKIAVNTKNDFLRLKYSNPQTVDLLEVDMVECQYSNELVNQICIEKAFNKLNLAEKELLLLKANGFNSNEISTLLNSNASTIRSRLATAKEHFKKALIDCGVDYNE